MLLVLFVRRFSAYLMTLMNQNKFLIESRESKEFQPFYGCGCRCAPRLFSSEAVSCSGWVVDILPWFFSEGLNCLNEVASFGVRMSIANFEIVMKIAMNLFVELLESVAFEQFVGSELGILCLA